VTAPAIPAGVTIRRRADDPPDRVCAVWRRAYLAEHEVCVRCWSQRSTEVHERLSRGRGGSIIDPNNCVALCAGCHRWITGNPAAAEAAGWLLPSWFEAARV
jgi:5-methylcytosine-specific restriction endonuclease McrA